MQCSPEPRVCLCLFVLVCLFVVVCVRGSASVKPLPLKSRESAQCILDVINLELEPVKEGEVEKSEKRGQSAGCTVQVVDMARNKRWNEKMFWAHNST